MALIKQQDATIAPETKTPEQLAADIIADETKTEPLLVAVNMSDAKFMFAYQFAKNWYGVRSQNWIDSQFESWFADFVNKQLKSMRKQITARLADKRLLDEVKRAK